MAKSKKKESDISFLSGFVQSRDVARVIAVIDEMAEEGENYSWLMKWTASDEKWVRFDVPWAATRMWVITDRGVEVVTTGPEGRVSILTPSGNSEEEIDNSPDGPPTAGEIRDLRGIGKGLYACGMWRQVYRRDKPGSWSRQDQGVLKKPSVKGIVGFNSIDGMDEDDVFAVGFGGEIWRRVKRKWRQLESPTNAILYRVRAIKKNLIYAAGQKGVLLRGNGDNWEQIDHTATKDDLWGMEWFGNTLYVSSDNAIYRLTAGDDLEKLNLGKIDTCGHLHANDGVMWSFGTKNVAYTRDAVKWTDVTP